MIQSATDANKINAGFEVNGARIQSAIDSRIINFPNQSDGINVAQKKICQIQPNQFICISIPKASNKSQYCKAKTKCLKQLKVKSFNLKKLNYQLVK